MKVVICDDSMEDLAEIERLLTKYIENREDIDLEIDQFTDSVELYHKIQAGAMGDIYILDMIMSEKTGIDIGTLIRSIDERGVIIYITSSDDFALEAYSVHAVRYLLKPVRETLFFEALDYAVSSITTKKREAVYSVKTKDGLAAVPHSRIEYIENYSRTLNIRLTDGKTIQSIFIRKSFDEEIRQISEDGSFIQVHKSFLVNMNHIDKLSQGSVLMASGKTIPISKTRAADVKKEYLKFIAEQYQ